MKIRWLISLLLLTFVAQAKPLELVFWHSMAGHLGDEVNQLVRQFNASQTDYQIKLVYKGEYTDSLTSYAAAFRAHKAPAIIQVFEVGTESMLLPKGIIKPVEELMREQHYSLDQGSFLPAIRSFYSENNVLQAMPFNTSLPVLYYNADALAKIGISANNLPKTWQELQQVIGKLRKNGEACGYTSAYPSWIAIESFAAIHGLNLTDKTKKAIYNDARIIRHLQRLKDWQQAHFFEYGGRASNATALFTSGRCIFFSQSSGSFNGLQEITPFKIGMTNLPLDAEITTIRKANVAGGAALWVTAGQSAQAYRGIAQFFSYLAQPAIQEQWHSHTGYIPIGLHREYEVIKEESQHPVLPLAEVELGQTTRHHYSGPQNLIRAINDEALEKIFANTETPEVAINEAVNRANYLLKRFRANTGTE